MDLRQRQRPGVAALWAREFLARLGRPRDDYVLHEIRKMARPYATEEWSECSAGKTFTPQLRMV